MPTAVFTATLRGNLSLPRLRKELSSKIDVKIPTDTAMERSIIISLFFSWMNGGKPWVYLAYLGSP